MVTEDLINLPLPASSSDESRVNEPDQLKELQLNGDKVEVVTEDMQLTGVDSDKDLGDNLAVLQVGVEMTEMVVVTENVSCNSSGVSTENDFLNVPDPSPSKKHEREDGSPIGHHDIDDILTPSAKRAKTIVAEQHQPTVHITYNSLARGSKQKLKELLQQWSEWHSKHCTSSRDSNEVLESGEETYFPALQVGLDKPSAVSFWMDNQISNQQGEESKVLGGTSVPLYDRGYSLALTSLDDSNDLEGSKEIVDSRCFNCGSYSHALKECPKPRDSVAINKSRNQHKSRRNQNPGSRNPTRYYQSSPGGKYDGLKPGVLSSTTRELLGLGMLDPPPWLNRMREMGYPPGYLDPDDEEPPSGITIFADEEEISQEKEDGEILEGDCPEPPPKKKSVETASKKKSVETVFKKKKMSVEFPGVNAPIPENADEWRWAAGRQSFDLTRNHSEQRRQSHHHHHEQRWSKEYYNDEGPPGVDVRYSPTVSIHHSHRYDGNNSLPRTPSFGRYSSSDRDSRSPLVAHHEGGSSDHGSSLHYSYHNRMHSPRSIQYDLGGHSSSHHHHHHRVDKHERHSHSSRR